MIVMIVRWFVVFVAAAVFSGYATAAGPEENKAGEPKPLLVGVTPDFPPLVFKQGDQIAGIEADLAKLLGQELGRPVKFVVLKWDAQISSLLEGKTDIIMSALSVTRERQVRVAFSEPYLKSGLVAAVLAEDITLYPTVESIMEVGGTVGIVPGTTADAFVRKNFPYAQTYHLAYPRQAPSALQNRWIAMFVGDAPTVIWIVSENESSVAGIWTPLNEEHLAWGMRKDDETLQSRVRVALAQFRQDGRLDQILKKWLPKAYLEKMK